MVDVDGTPQADGPWSWVEEREDGVNASTFDDEKKNKRTRASQQNHERETTLVVELPIMDAAQIPNTVFALS